MWKTIKLVEYFVDCRNTRDYNTQVITEIKGKLNIRIHKDITGEMWFGVDVYF